MQRRKSNRDGVFTRRGSFYISFTDVQGRRKQRKLKGVISLTQAKELRSAELLRVEKARVLGYTPPTKDTVAELTPRYLRHQEARLTPAAYERTRGILEGHLKSFFGEIRLADIRRADVQRYITARCADVSGATVTKELNVLKHLLGLAVEWELIAVNVASRVKPPRVAAGRVRYLQPTELNAVLGACPDWLRPIVGLAVATGMRRSEILGLRWLDIDLEHHRIMLPQTKNGDGRIVYLNQSARAAVAVASRSEETVPTDLVFGGITPAQVSVRFKYICTKQKVLDFRFHDLRHTAASWLRMKGADIHTVAQLLGHKDLRMAARYQHLSPTFLADAVARLDAAYGPLALGPAEQASAMAAD